MDTCGSKQVVSKQTVCCNVVVVVVVGKFVCCTIYLHEICSWMFMFAFSDIDDWQLIDLPACVIV